MKFNQELIQIYFRSRLVMMAQLELLILLSVFCASNLASAHVIGNGAWCRKSGPIHFEFFFDQESACARYNKMMKDPSAEWSCETQPSDPEIRNAKDLQSLIKQKK